ncbi:hypothetical protein IVB15_10050 [Bradyrhizobium sp. 182]|uniref:hypothetical protein n=1 Tax=unclassified Bradyrhizobium TaxID=2631580 RepID=UPI001FFAEEE8|nr:MULTISPECIES: hypothetical protein [unclassified Bradyrhizobium]MCK1424056.1 hypothetical protein [Bradyrhizobium sp. CW12]MCK1528071.1 hypothetical protein [Bradyrhizobium sp. 182]MCK1647371.1 hypothetical protein [Bradyrhizobium sp. 154]
MKHEAPLEQEIVVKQLRRAKRPTQSAAVIPHGRETDANREFAPDRGSDDIVWFFIALSMFIVAHAICVRIGAI